ncbi:DUF3656 domain-containing U32 family peptidase [Natronincola peptidivorans]|nr:U32 family peptidase [Natronincola peptidivorans]
MGKVELLAPAGSYEAFHAAVQNGADAVYLGGTAFSARAYASNFEMETLEKAMKYAHLRGVKVYVTINTLIKDVERKELLQYINRLYSIGIDAIIVQDLGVIQIVREVFPDLEIHCSTQMTLHNSEGINLLTELGVKRVVLARELSLKDIKKIYDNTQAELEVFIHGALCYSYSGQCLMSSFIGGRSGNRGRCAQPCRKKYEIISLNKEIVAKSQGYYMSMRDLNVLNNIGEVIESGVFSFKIEGRMKKPHYVASIVRAYRRAIDDYLLYKKPFMDEKVTKEITQVFNRKFTKGYLLSSTTQNIINPEKPNNRGLFLGKIKEYNIKNKRITIKLMENIRQGDGIEIWSNISGSNGGVINKIFLHNELIHEAAKGETVDIQFLGSIQKGDDVFKTLDLQLMKHIEKSYEAGYENKKVKIYGEIKVLSNMPIKLWLWDNEENIVYQESKEIVERARKVALTEEKIIENISKLGNTPFQMETIQVTIDKNISIPISSINQVRRDAVEALSNLRSNRNTKQPKPLEKIVINHRHTSLREKTTEKYRPRLAVKVDSYQQLKYVLQQQVERVYYGNTKNLEAALELCKSKEVEIYFRSPAIIKDNEQEILKEILTRYSFDGLLAGDLGMIVFGRKTLKKPVIADFTLNIMNSSTVEFMKKQGVSGVTLSTELDLKNIKNLKVNRSLEVEIIVYGKLPIMVTEACPLIIGDVCNHQCKECKDEAFHYLWGLKDEKDAIFPFTKDEWGRTVVLNSCPLYMIDKVEDLAKIYTTSYRLDFTNETPQEIINIVTNYKKNIDMYFNNGSIDNSKVKEGINHYTRGHFYRGIE